MFALWDFNLVDQSHVCALPLIPSLSCPPSSSFDALPFCCLCFFGIVDQERKGRKRAVGTGRGAGRDREKRLGRGQLVLRDRGMKVG